MHSCCNLYISFWLFVYMWYRCTLISCRNKRFWAAHTLFLKKSQTSARPVVGARCYQLFCTIVELSIEPPVIEHDACSMPEFRSSVPELASFGQPFLFSVEMTMPHGVVIKCVSRGVLNGSVPLDLTIKQGIPRSFFPSRLFFAFNRVIIDEVFSCYLQSWNARIWRLCLGGLLESNIKV